MCWLSSARWEGSITMTSVKEREVSVRNVLHC
jgi:hypothetical protein